MPNYVGAVRTMVVAGDISKEAYGSTDKSVRVKKPLMVLATLPRKLSMIGHETQDREFLIHWIGIGWFTFTANAEIMVHQSYQSKPLQTKSIHQDLHSHEVF